MGKTYDNSILSFHLDKTLNDLLNQLTEKLKINVIVADCVTDLIAYPCFMQVINPAQLSEEDQEELLLWLNLIHETYDPRYMSIILTSSPLFKMPKKVERFILKTPEVLDYDYLKLKVLNKLTAIKRHDTKNKTHDRMIFRVLKILKVLKTERILYIEDMCNEFNVSRKTINRDIDLLNALGEIIEYDKVKKGYAMVMEDGEYSQHL